MSSAAHAVSIVVAIALAYLWLQVPILNQYSLQIFAAMMIIFFVVKRFRKAEIWHIAPDPGSLELTIITFAFLLLIGATGNTESIFYPLGYIHLFFIVMACTVPTAIIATAFIMLFHYALEPMFDVSHMQALITLPIMLVLFAFAKHQYDQAKFKQQLLKEEKDVIDSLTTHEQELESFLGDFLHTKLHSIKEFATELTKPDQLTEIVHSIEDESTKLLDKIRHKKTSSDEK